MVEREETNLLIRIIYFLLIGWWLGQIIIAVTWFFFITIIGIPLGIWLIDRLPTFVTLRAQERYRTIEGLEPAETQRPFLVRALYFIFIGWWFSLFWLEVAYLLMLTIIGIPLAFLMFERAGAVTTLYRY